MVPEDSIAWLDGSFIPRSALAIQVDDLGFSQGVTAVERLRTWNGHLPLLHRHLERFEKSVQSLQLRGVPSVDELAGIIHRLLGESASGDQTLQRMSFESLVRADNTDDSYPKKPQVSVPFHGVPLHGVPLHGVPLHGVPLHGGHSVHNPRSGKRDVGITLLATAGRPVLGRATVAVHLNPLDHDRLAGYWNEGQPIVMTDVVQPPPESWPREIKVRSRLHYYFADLYAREKNPAAIGILRDLDGSITEASTCNVYLARPSGLVAPPLGRVLPGIMGETVCRVVGEMGVRVERRPIWPEELREGRVWLTGSEGGLWFASSIDGKPCSADAQLRETQARLLQFLIGTTLNAAPLSDQCGEEKACHFDLLR